MSSHQHINRLLCYIKWCTHLKLLHLWIMITIYASSNNANKLILESVLLRSCNNETTARVVCISLEAERNIWGESTYYWYLIFIFLYLLKKTIYLFIRLDPLAIYYVLCFCTLLRQYMLILTCINCKYLQFLYSDNGVSHKIEWSFPERYSAIFNCRVRSEDEPADVSEPEPSADVVRVCYGLCVLVVHSVVQGPRVDVALQMKRIFVLKSGKGEGLSYIRKISSQI